MNENTQSSVRGISPLHAALSLILPGLGQMVAGLWARGVSILLTVFVLGGLSIWTISQRARFPDYLVGRNVFLPLVLQSLALLTFLIALRYLLARFVIRDAATESFSVLGLGVLYLVLVFFAAGAFLELAASEEARKMVFEATAVYSAAAIAALWLWQARDAGLVATAPPKEMPSLSGGILVACLLIFVLGFNITGIDIPKAIAEYQDTNIILRRIVWPWRNAFEFERITVQVDQKIQAPCPPGSIGPPANEPLSGEAWVSASPTCGDLTERDLQGNVTLGTELTIFGGGFTPGEVVEILWKNPIGNPFTPRGVGETRIPIDDNGEFTTTLFIPEATIASTAVGEQVHTLQIVQESELVFTGRLSKEMNLALVGMLETIMIGLMATFFGIILAFPVSFLAARNLMLPIVSGLSGIVGSVLGLALGLWLAFLGTGRIADFFGGLAEAPLQIFTALLILLLTLGYLGLQIGSRLFTAITKQLGASLASLITALSLTLLAAVPGYLLGLGFSRGIVAIPQNPEVAALNEGIFAIAGAVILGLAAFVFALRVGAQGQVSAGLVVYTVVRTILNIVRSIEPLIWAIVAAIWVGLGPFAGTIALTLHTIAALGKLYSESIESIDPGPIEALQATGATRLQTIVYAVVPQILPPFISFTIYRWDINVRLSTIIGLVGGGGIGFILIQWIRQFQYENAGIAVWLITITVATLDYVSSNIRERFV